MARETTRFSRKDSPQARETKLNTLVEKIVDSPPHRLPIGSVYLTTLSDNPAFILGYGTWELIDSGILFN